MAVPDTSFHKNDISRSSSVEGRGRSLQFPNSKPGGIHVLENRAFSINVPQQNTFQNLDPLPSFAGLENGITFARDQQGIIRPFRIVPLPLPQNPPQHQFGNQNILNLFQSREVEKINEGRLKFPDEFYQTNFNVKPPGPETCLCSQVQQSQFGPVFEAVPQNKRRIFRKRKVLTPNTTKAKSSICWNRGFRYSCSSF